MPIGERMKIERRRLASCRAFEWKIGHVFILDLVPKCRNDVRNPRLRIHSNEFDILCNNQATLNIFEITIDSYTQQMMKIPAEVSE